MGHVTIQSQGLTAEQVFTVFQSGLAGRYEVRRSALPAVDFVVRRSALVGVGVKLQQKGGEARLRCAPMVPSTLLRMVLLNGLLSSLFMWPVLKRTTREVEAFAASAAGLHGEDSPAPATPAPTAAQPPSPHSAAAATWVGITALFIPTVVSTLFGFPRLLVSGPIVTQAIVTALLAFFVPRLSSARVLRSPVLVGLAAWVASSLALSVFSWGMTNEVRGWFSRYGVAEFAVLLVSLYVLARVARSAAPEAVPAAAAA